MLKLSDLLSLAAVGCAAFLACMFQEQQDLSPGVGLMVDTPVATVPRAVNSKPASEKVYETPPIDFITVTCRSRSTALSLPLAPKGWIGVSDATRAFSLVYDPTTCSSPSEEFSSFFKTGTSTVGFEARRLIAGYREGYPGSQDPKLFEDVENLKRSFLKKLQQDGSMGKGSRRLIAEDVARRLAKAKLEHDSRLVISVASELEPRLTTHTDDELIVRWERGELRIGDLTLSSDELINGIQEQNIHHLMLKLPPASNVSFSSVQALLNCIRQNAKHVKIVEVRLD